MFWFWGLKLLNGPTWNSLCWTKTFQLEGEIMSDMRKERGYQKQLLVLPFDHRASFQEKMFGIKGTPTPEQTKEIASYKDIIFEGFEKAVKSGLPREVMGVLVDERDLYFIFSLI